MCIVRRFAFITALLIVPKLHAHPVAQGALEVFLSNDKIELHLRVSLEEILVANNFATTPAASLPEAVSQHGDYLLHHVRVFADDAQLPGTRVSVEEPQSGRTHLTYVFAYPLTHPAQLFRIEEDVLNEYDYAPGNRWEATYLARVLQNDQAMVDGALLSAKTPLSFSVNSRGQPGRMARDYFRHGIAHILNGWDHLLFISALALAVTSFWELLKVIAAFTLAHTITLTLSVLNVVRLPPHVVEPMIAASIIIVALQNLLWPARSHGAPRLAVAFFFGLFHGLGFAGGLVAAMETMPGLSLGTAILAFSAGVEVGHQFVVLPVFALTRFVRAWSKRERFDFAPMWLLRGGSAAICAAGLFYFALAISQ
jgi:hydrogenase/urease accessory protein HupE